MPYFKVSQFFSCNMQNINIFFSPIFDYSITNFLRLCTGEMYRFRKNSIVLLKLISILHSNLSIFRPIFHLPAPFSRLSELLLSSVIGNSIYLNISDLAILKFIPFDLEDFNSYPIVIFIFPLSWKLRKTVEVVNGLIPDI